ncbi:ABC transporter ATP-binding protein [Nocardioides humi]|uniref:ABC transporter ATP-binding protein n=1 Tax=Nocardioides humi TaxID=449461 RepID=A0ABN2BQD7_9ACTN|nr:ABC transporter ATP-binding protein [Nocardioides humi]
MSALVLEDVCAGYGAGDVLGDVGLRVDPGEIVVILGANGAGKTTLMRAISGTIARRGTVRLGDRDLVRAKPDQIVRAGVVQVPQGRGTIADLSVEDNLRLGAYIRRDKEVAKDLAHWYDVYPRLAERRKQKAGFLSGGEQQMLAIARTLMTRPRVLLCDEPSLGLSPRLTSELFASLASLNKELDLSILVVEQNAMVALAIASRAYLLEAGRLAPSRDAAELMSDDAIKTAYLGG